MRNRYTFTTEGLRNIAVYSISATEVWQVLHSSRRLTRELGQHAAGIFGVTAEGRYLVVLVAESGQEDNDWDVVAARDMNARETSVFNRYIGRK